MPSKSGDRGGEERQDVERHPIVATEGRMADDGEVTSPLKRDTPGAKEKETIKSGTGRRLF